MTVRLGMVGCGFISHAHGRAAVRSGGAIAFAACCSRTAEQAGSWAREYGCEAAYTDIAQLLAHPRLDGVVIATRPAGHAAHITACLDAGQRFVLCEKALVTSSAAALEVLRRARAAGATIIEAWMYRHHPAFVALREEVAGLGTVDHLHAEFDMLDPAREDPEAGGWRRDPAAGGGVPFDFACYPVDAANLLAGALPVRVIASAFTNPHHGTIDRLFGLIEYANGCVATLASSRHASLGQLLRVCCERGRVELPMSWNAPADAVLTVTTSPAFLQLAQRLRRFPSAPAGELADLPVYGLQLGHFADVIRGRAAPAVTLAQSVLNIIVLESLVAAGRTGSALQIELPTGLRGPASG
ncbi:MAG: Gfo/Idh/MocA family oxidoreductase [Gammaproteobacteria bacterium]|nr:MAG: Gfo/Idh/MocA family oxidoreductase [Gammaproteobacteria bacterium]